MERIHAFVSADHQGLDRPRGNIEEINIVLLIASDIGGNEDLSLLGTRFVKGDTAGKESQLFRPFFRAFEKIELFGLTKIGDKINSAIGSGGRSGGGADLNKRFDGNASGAAARGFRQISAV